MINKLKFVKEEIARRCKLAGVPTTGEYPECIGRLPGHFPQVLIESNGIPDLTNTNNNITNYDYICTVILLTQTGHGKTPHHEDLVFRIINEIYKDTNLAGTCTRTQPVSIEFNADVPMVSSAYASGSIQASRTQFEFRLNDFRYSGRETPGLLPSPTITLSTPNVGDIPGAGGSYTIEVTANVGWEIVDNYDWLSCSPMHGEPGTTTVTVTVGQSSDPENSRSAALVFVSREGETATCHIEQ